MDEAIRGSRRRFALTSLPLRPGSGALPSDRGDDRGARCRRDTRGFTLVETLVALAIVVLLSGVVANAMPVATNAYYKLRDTSNAQVALSTATAALRAELGSTFEVRKNGTVTGESGTYDFYRSGDGLWVRLDCDADEGTILKRYYREEAAGIFAPVQVQQYDKSGTLGPNPTALVVPLIPKAALPDGMRLWWDSVSYVPQDGIWTIEGLCVQQEDHAPGASRKTLAQIGSADNYSDKKDFTVRSRFCAG